LLVHGDADELMPVEEMHKAAQIINAAGISAQAHARPGLSHGIDMEGLQLAASFFEQVLHTA